VGLDGRCKFLPSEQGSGKKKNKEIWGIFLLKIYIFGILGRSFAPPLCPPDYAFGE